MAFLREETKKRGFKTVDGVHMGPCEIHKQHAHTIGPTGRSTRARASPATRPSRPGTSTAARTTTERRGAAVRQDHGVEECNDCAFIPVCAGGCSAASHTELGDMNKPNCHKPSFEAGVIVGAAGRARRAGGGGRLGSKSVINREKSCRARKENERERQERLEEKGHPAAVAGRRLARPPAVGRH